MLDKKMQNVQSKANILADALPYLRDFNQKIFIIGYLGSNCLSADQEQEIMRDIALLHSIGIKPVIVHDTRMGSDKFRENKRLAKLVEFCGPKAVGICGIDEQTLHMTLENGYVPVVSPYDIDTEYLNISPSESAQKVAAILNAEKLIYLGKYVGVMDENGEKIQSMNRTRLSDILKEGQYESDPVFKEQLTNALAALDHGVSRVHFVEGSRSHGLLLELFSIIGVGTVITQDNGKLYKHEKERKQGLAAE